MKTYRKHFLIKCKSCGFVFAKKIPSIVELENHYKQYERRDYISPVTVKRYHEILDSFEPYRKSNMILDVGCGVGFFLETAKQRGWNVYGTEFTDDAIEINKKKGIIVSKGALTNETFNEIKFDVITSFEVIEHINNPLQEMHIIYNMLRKGGLFYCTTPNFNAIERILLKDKYNIITYPEHLSYYTPKTLQFLMAKCGLKKSKVETTGISITRLKTSLGKSNQAFVSASSDDEILRGSIEKNKVLKQLKLLLNKTLTFFGVGVSLKGSFVKE